MNREDPSGPNTPDPRQGADLSWAFVAVVLVSVLTAVFVLFIVGGSTAFAWQHQIAPGSGFFEVTVQVLPVLLLTFAIGERAVFGTASASVQTKAAVLAFVAVLFTAAIAEAVGLTIIAVDNPSLGLRAFGTVFTATAVIGALTLVIVGAAISSGLSRSLGSVFEGPSPSLWPLILWLLAWVAWLSFASALAAGKLVLADGQFEFVVSLGVLVLVLSGIERRWGVWGWWTDWLRKDRYAAVLQGQLTAASQKALKQERIRADVPEGGPPLEPDHYYVWLYAEDETKAGERVKEAFASAGVPFKLTRVSPLWIEPGPSPASEG